MLAGKGKKKTYIKKVPMIMQLEALECGAACLAMILAFYGKWVPLEQVRKDCGVSRDGSNARNILLAARNYGMEASGYRYDVETILEEENLPCIIFWNCNHFVVLTGCKGDRVLLNDPARGAVSVSYEEFDESFTGICLMMNPGENFEPGGKPKSVVNFIREQMRGSATAVVFTIAVAVLSSLIGVIRPGFTRIFLDRLLTKQNPEWVIPFFAVLSIFTLLQIMVAFAGTEMAAQINGKMAVTGSSRYFWKVLCLPMEFFSQRMAGDLYQRQGMNADIAKTIVDTIAPLGLHAGMLVFYLVVMLRYSPILSFLGILSVLLNVWISHSIAKRRINMTRVQMRDEGKLVSTTVSGLEMIETIKASGAENGYFQRWAGYQASVNSNLVDYTQKTALLEMLPSLVSSLTGILVTIIGVWLIMNGRFTIGMLTAFQGYLTAFLTPAGSLITSGRQVQQMRTQMERIDDVMKYPEESRTDADDTEEPIKKLSGRLSMRNVTFGYSKLGEPVIKDFNLDLEPGKSVAFVGASGCGKSTLSKLISGLYQPWSGEILFDGKPLKKINRDIFTGSLAVVDQDIILFEDTVLDNIRMWDESIEDFEVIMAARDAQIHEDIMMRKDGYRHVIREGGKDFSGGQRQRLEIARVLAQDPTIVILDEATSALDAKTEAAVVKNIAERGITCIIVAHRLSTIRDCDEILVLEKGIVKERGTHSQLYAQGGLYTELVSND